MLAFSVAFGGRVLRFLWYFQFYREGTTEKTERKVKKRTDSEAAAGDNVVLITDKNGTSRSDSRKGSFLEPKTPRGTPMRRDEIRDNIYFRVFTFPNFGLLNVSFTKGFF